MQPDTKLAFQRALTRTLVWLALSIAIVGVAGVVAALVLRSTGRKRRDEALERIRARGEPMKVIDAVRPPSGTGEDPGAWMKSFDDLPYAEVDVSALPECAHLIRPGKDNSELIADLRYQWLDPSRIDRPTPCELAVLRRMAEVSPADLAKALEVERYRNLDWSRTVVDDGTMDALLPRAPYPGAVGVVEQMTQAALVAASRGNLEEAVRRLDLAQRGAALLEDSPFLLAYQAWTFCQTEVCCATVRVASLVPPGSEFDSIAARLSAVDPRAQLQRAILGDRALGIQIFAAIHSGDHGFEGFAEYSGLARFVQRLWFEHDEADYLEEMEHAVAAASQPHAIGGETTWKPRFYNIVSAMLMPRWNGQIANAAELEARLLLTRAALLAHRDGFDAARAWAGTQLDPFAKLPLRTRIDADGALSIWSVGPNLIDDDAPLSLWYTEDWNREPALDVLVRCAPR
jgi:hypothetical protein